MPSSSVKTRSRSGGGGSSGSSSYSKALSIVPYTSSYDTSSLKSPKSPSSSSSYQSRHYTSPLPSLSISTATESLLLGMKSSLISPGSARALRYTRSSSASVTQNSGGGATLEVQRTISSNSYALLAGVTPEGPKSPSSSSASQRDPYISQRSPISMFPIMSKSLLRYRHHSFTRSPSIMSTRRCGSADPEIYRRISLSRQMSNYSTIPSSTTSTLDTKGYSLSSRSHSASCSNSRSGSMERYTRSGSTSSSNTATTRQQHHSGPVNNQKYSSSPSYPLLTNGSTTNNGNAHCNGSSVDQHTHDGGGGGGSGSKLVTTTTAARQCVTELARSVSSHHWDSEPSAVAAVESRQEIKEANGFAQNKNGTDGNDDDANVNKLNGSMDHNHDLEKVMTNGHVHHDSGSNGMMTASTKEYSRQSSVATTSDLDSTASDTTTLVPASAVNSNGVNGHAATVSHSHRNGRVNGYHHHPPPPPPILAVAQSTTRTSQRITAIPGGAAVTTSTTDIIDMKFVNGFVHLMGNNGTSSGSLDRIYSPTKSTRQRIRLAKLQNKYGVFKSWLTPEDEQTLARVRNLY